MVKTIKKTEPHPIDQMVALLLQRASRSGAKGTLLLETYQAWEELMLLCYREVLELCASECKSQMEESQRNWVRFRDVEYNLLDRIYSLRVSPLILETAAQRKNELIRARALQLYDYRDLLRNYRKSTSEK